MSEAPANVWLRQGYSGQYYACVKRPNDGEGDGTRYVRADLYEAALGRLAVVRSWNEAPCLEPLGETS